MSFFDSEFPEDSQEEQTHEVSEEELDTEDSETEDHDDDGYDDDSDEEDSTADDEDEDHEEDDGDDSDSTEVEATDIDDKDFKLVIDGEEVTLSGKELKSGYMRQANYTKKTQELATKRQALEVEYDTAVRRSEAVKFNAQSEMEKFDGALRQFGGWDGLKRESTPEQFEQFSNRYIQIKKDFEIAEDIINETTNSMRTNNAKQIEDIFKEMARTNDGFTKESINDMDRFLSNRGFTEDMVLSMTTPEAWNIVYDAMKYAKLQERTEQSVKTEKKKEIKTKEHKAAPVNKTSKGSSTKRSFEKGLKAQKNARGAEQSKITQDLLRKLL